MKTIVENALNLFQEFEAEASKNLGGNKAAGARARKLSLELEKAMKSFRKASIEAAKAVKA